MDRLDDTWYSLEYPVLLEVARALQLPQNAFAGVHLHVIVEATTLPAADVVAAVRALEADGLIELRWVSPTGRSRVRQISGEARRLVGLWPTPETALDRIIAALEAIAANTDDEDTRTRARKILDGLAGAGKTIGLSVAAAAITGQIPGTGS